LIQGRRVAAGCHGALARVQEAVLTFALYVVLVTDAELVAEGATALTVVYTGRKYTHCPHLVLTAHKPA
jgi:hypothetical protein